MLTGIIEGFYGPPWTWDERAEVTAWCAARGMSTYVYAPKDDPKHRQAWREPYTGDEIAAFERFLEAGDVRLGFALSPGVSIDYSSADDIAALVAKCTAMVAVGVDLVVLALDDIAPAPGLGAAHAELFERLRHAVAPADVLLVPTDYTGTRPGEYLDGLAAGLDGPALVAWTGSTVVADRITAEEAAARAEALGGRRPVLWDNYPVNDAVMADRLFLGPLRGRDAALLAQLDGYLANPMVQARPSLLPLASTAAWLRGDDVEATWAEEAEALGWRTFAEACDGEVPRRLVARWIAGDDDGGLTRWLDGARTCTAPGIDEACAAWLDQVHAEASLASDALRLAAEGSTDAWAWLGLALRWRSLPSATATVMGPRRSVRPVVCQDATGGFVVPHPGAAVDRDLNAVDHLVQHLLDTVVA